ncbi:MAG: DNA gyrase inhibitor YacG [Rhodocyclaceae bacterium]
MTKPSAVRVVKCPTCGKPVPWLPENKWRPFCSERCRTIDLGAWANEAYRVPVSEPSGADGDDPVQDSSAAS